MAALFRRKRLKGEFAYKFAPVHALREQGTRTNPSEEENKKRTADAIRFLLWLQDKIITSKGRLALWAINKIPWIFFHFPDPLAPYCARNH